MLIRCTNCKRPICWEGDKSVLKVNRQTKSLASLTMDIIPPNLEPQCIQTNGDSNNHHANSSVPQRKGRYAGANLRRPSSASTTDANAVNTLTTTTSRRQRPPVRRYTPVPLSLLNDPELLSDSKALPSNYSLELAKTIHRAREIGARRVALQMPEGLLLYATTIGDILRRHAESVTSVVVLGDVTYGACCVDDLSADALQCDLLVHYGHSCLVPVSQTRIPTLYVFVHIAFDLTHLRKVMRANFSRDDRIALVATIQFVDAIHRLREEACPEDFDFLFVPQKKPLSPGELLGCTAPILPGGQKSSCACKDDKTVEYDILLYVGDGRFHLESAMIANPCLKAFRYDPYSKTITRESYAHDEMHAMRLRAIEAARKATNFGIILGTLGRQGSPAILRRLLSAMRDTKRNHFVVLLSELSPKKLERIELAGVEAWVQIACPRLSIDWGERYSSSPLLSSYECFVALGKVQWKDVYPMDYYSKDGGEWSNYYKEKRPSTKSTQSASVISPSVTTSKA